MANEKKAPSYLELTNYLCSITNRDGYSENYDRYIQLLLINHPSVLDITTFAKVLSLLIMKSMYYKKNQTYLSFVLLDTLEQIEENKTNSEHLRLNNTPINKNIYSLINRLAVQLDKKYKVIKQKSLIHSLVLIVLFACFIYFILQASLLMTLVISLIVFIIDYQLSIHTSMKKYTEKATRNSRTSVHPIILTYIDYYIK